jgi:drug/metabolite transporter (DMT)-like permease
VPVEVLALASAVMFGVTDYVGGVTAKRAPAPLVVFWAHLAGAGLAVLTAAWVGVGGMTGDVWLWGSVAGVGGAVGLVALYGGLATGRMAVVSPVSAVVGTSLPVAYGVGRGERPELTVWVGIGVALVAIFLVSSSGSIRGSGLREGLLAGVGFGSFFIALANTGSADGLWPLVPARLSSLVVLAALLAGRKALAPLPRVARVGAIGAGAGDMASNLLYLAAVHRGTVATVVVLASLYPAVTVLAARTITKEPVGAIQWLGVGMAVTAVVLISA